MNDCRNRDLTVYADSLEKENKSLQDEIVILKEKRVEKILDFLETGFVYLVGIALFVGLGALCVNSCSSSRERTRAEEQARLFVSREIAPYGYQLVSVYCPNRFHDTLICTAHLKTRTTTAMTQILLECDDDTSLTNNGCTVVDRKQLNLLLGIVGAIEGVNHGGDAGVVE